MGELIKYMLEWFGLSAVPTTFPEFITWFVAFCIGVCIVVHVMDWFFYLVRMTQRGFKS